ncbi:1,2-phenylacetyl-CoA epoxidase subunit PaaC [Actinomadura bangladeshensis]|uniref:Phenylacetate-CoA oxygenase subunit PaaI n=1 Tax=Actinomadura bangladeshensis TaxID=453573 RepID=A0A4R4PCY0_9ACTN|nr:1,2-phenylacetyl-CoA epoxidase subunit PaaC [Actinomadura bangladeshensis]TDC18953.1 phenylacetate-CoA oxygenase subunit PaaI [Actinomadura bangladeshensis]
MPSDYPSSDNPFEALSEESDDARWAFGTGFDDPLAGIDPSVPDGVDRGALAAYCLMLGDDALVMSHRLQEWCTHAPELEEEVALANIALDLLGQARLLLARAGVAEDKGRGEDDLAYFRDASDFRNVGLAEVENGDFAHSTVRLLLFATWRLALLDRLTTSRDPVLAAIAAKGVKEVAYHRDHAALWTVRLGDGTDLSHERAQLALDDLWPHTGELFTAHEVERLLADAGVAVDPAGVHAEFDAVLDEVLSRATLRRPEPVPAHLAGRDGAHSPALAGLLTEMQSLARDHPGAAW